MRWRVQFGINSTSDVWKFCQNWTSRRGESNLANFQTSRVILIPNCMYEQHRMIICLLLAYDKIGYFSVNIIFSRQSPVLPDFQPEFGTFVRIFI
jgi:hypothetical protein